VESQSPDVVVDVGLDDAGIDLDEPLPAEQLDALLTTAASSLEKLRSAAKDFADKVVSVAADRWFVQAFEPAAPNRAEIPDATR
jgi:hypothetical protein